MPSDRVANNGETTPGGVTGRGWTQGHSGNPNGRPRGIASRAREIIGNDPARMLNVLVEIAENPEEKSADRRAAAEALLDRAYGKAPSYAPVEDSDPLERGSLTERIDTLMDELAERRTARAAGQAPDGSLAGVSEG